MVLAVKEGINEFMEIIMNFLTQYTLPEWIQMITSSATAITAIIMAVYAYKQYLKTPHQSSQEEIDSRVEKGDGAQLTAKMVLFKTSTQKTTLIVEKEGLKCYLGTPRKLGLLQWTIDPNEAKRILENDEISVYPEYKMKTGTFRIGKRTNWLYSKELFPSPEDLRNSLTNMVKNAAEYAK